MIRALLYEPEEKGLRHGGAELIDVWEASQSSVIWVVLEDESKDAESELLSRRFGIHRLAIADLIDVNATFGQVENIGARSTAIKTFDNFHIIVPNSTFLESNVVNWTHTDNLVRISLMAGVAYGSPARKVEEILLEVVREHGKTVTPPDPVVLFNDFGDSALIFQTLFWIEMNRPMDQRRVLSDLRFWLDERFHEAGIVIAFPQRDLHIDSFRPLQVQMVGKPVD